MSENYCTTRGLGWATLILVGFILFVPMGMTYASVGHDDYGKYRKMTPIPVSYTHLTLPTTTPV